MSLVTLNTVRYYTNQDVYHYTIDNRPLQDLASNDVLLQAGLDILAASITGSGITAKDYAAGTDFTAGTTTSLTLPGVPAGLTSLWVFFDGIYQNVNTYTLSGNVITFGSAIPVGISSVEVKWSNNGSPSSFSTTLIAPVTDSNYTMPVARDYVVVFSNPLTANRTVTLSATSTQGYTVRVTRDATCTGAFSVTIQNAALAGIKLLNTAGTWADFVYTGSAWIQSAGGSL